MNAEMKFSQFLGSMPTTSMQKTAQAMDQLSIDELETLLREEMKKEAYVGGDDLIGGVIGYHEGKKQKARGEHHTFGVPQGLAVAAIPGGVGYQIGRYMGHQDPHTKRGKEKKSSVETSQEKVAMADDMGRALAQQTFEKLALGAGAMGALGKGVNAVMGAGHGTRAAVGAAGGAALGAAKNVIAPQRDASGNPVKGGVMRGALRGAAGGAALGLAAKPALGALGSSQTGVGQTIRNASAGATAAAAAKAVPANKMLAAAPANNMFTPEAVAARKAQRAAPQASTISGSEGVGEVRKIKRPTSGPGSVQKGAPPPGGQTIDMQAQPYRGGPSSF